MTLMFRVIRQRTVSEREREIRLCETQGWFRASQTVVKYSTLIKYKFRRVDNGTENTRYKDGIFMLTRNAPFWLCV